MRKGQAALEYLITYGWAFLAILVVLGALAYFGLLSPTRYLPARCDFGVQMECVDYVLEDNAAAGNDQVRIQFRNNFGDAINITDIIPDEGGGALTTPINDLRVAQGNVSKVLTFQYDDSTYLIGGERQSIVLTITFRRDKADSPLHNVSGEIFATVQ